MWMNIDENFTSSPRLSYTGACRYPSSILWIIIVKLAIKSELDRVASLEYSENLKNAKSGSSIEKANLSFHIGFRPLFHIVFVRSLVFSPSSHTISSSTNGLMLDFDEMVFGFDSCWADIMVISRNSGPSV